jgi:ligand-binding SRPBCC domain-containing protein
VRTFDFEFTVPASQARVRDFHHDTSVLRVLTPPPAIMQVHSMEPLAEGSVSRFTIWAGPIPLRWEATHQDVSASGFTDVQTDGPMKSWAHTHQFIEMGSNETKVTEHIEYEHGGGFWGIVTRALFAPPALKALFLYRKFQTIRHCKR